MADLPRAQRLDHRRLVDERAARGVDEEGAAPHRGDACRRKEAARLVGEQEMERDGVALGQQSLDGDELDARRVCFRRPVPGDHLHADAERHARDLGGDAAVADQAERLARELRAFAAQPATVAHRPVHRRELARGVEQETDRALGDGGVAVALDEVDGDADRRERLRIHVAARAGAEEDDVAQAVAARCDLGRQRGVVDDRDRCAGERRGQRIGHDVGVAEGELELRQHARPDRLGERAQRRVGVDEDGAHGSYPACPRSAIAAPKRTGPPGCHAGSKRKSPLGNSSTTVEPSMKRPISSPFFRDTAPAA